MRFVLASLGLLLVADCAGSAMKTAELPRTKPVLESQIVTQAVLSHRATLWKDPASIQNASIADPYACTAPTISGGQIADAPATCVCLELNARNSYGGYTGLKRSILAIQESGEMQFLDFGSVGPTQHCESLRPLSALNGKVR